MDRYAANQAYKHLDSVSQDRTTATNSGFLLLRVQNNNVLLTIGYSFSDEHINNLIYQAFTIPTFRLIVLGDLENKAIEKLKSLNDPRIWIIGGELGEGKKLHFFDGFVEKILPDLSNDDLDKKMDFTISELIGKIKNE